MFKKTIHSEIFDNELINFDVSRLQEISQDDSSFKISKHDLKKKIKISISSDYTTNYFTEILRLFLINKKIQPEIYESEFGSLRYDVIDLRSNFWNKEITSILTFF